FRPTVGFQDLLELRCLGRALGSVHALETTADRLQIGLDDTLIRVARDERLPARFAYRLHGRVFGTLLEVALIEHERAAAPVSAQLMEQRTGAAAAAATSRFGEQAARLVPVRPHGTAGDEVCSLPRHGFYFRLSQQLGILLSTGQ